MTAQPGTPVTAEAAARTPFPFPFDRRLNNSNVSCNLYLQFPAEDFKGGAAEIPESTSGSPTFFVAEAIAEYSTTENYFQLKKAPSADAEINIGKLTNTAKGFFTGKGGSMDKEWNNMISQVKQEGGPAVRIHRGARAREIMKNYPDRLIPSRWMHRWKDFGDDFETPLPSKEILQNDIPLTSWSQISLDPPRLS